MVLWEYATAVAGAELGVNPFDQPNVESAKVAARELLTAPAQKTRVEDSLEGLSVFTSAPATAPASLSGIPSLLGELAGPHGYIALCVFGPRESVDLWRGCADALERATGRPVTVGFGPRFLHSTGQLHKGGAPEGVFLHIIQTPQAELEIPGRDFDFWQLLLAQAHGDAEVLARSGQPVLSLTGDASDVTRVREALQN
jgi:glucose-6-phosphate isomerase